jgi:hypothetical protein
MFIFIKQCEKSCKIWIYVLLYLFSQTNFIPSIDIFLFKIGKVTCHTHIPSKHVPLVLFVSGTRREAKDYDWVHSKKYASCVIELVDEPTFAEFDRIDLVFISKIVRTTFSLNFLTIFAGHSFGSLIAHHAAFHAQEPSGLILFSYIQSFPSKSWNLDIRIPVLMVNSEFDCVTPNTASFEVTQNTNSTFVDFIMVPGATHSGWGSVSGKNKNSPYGDVDWCDKIDTLDQIESAKKILLNFLDILDGTQTKLNIQFARISNKSCTCCDPKRGNRRKHWQDRICETRDIQANTRSMT